MLLITIFIVTMCNSATGCDTWIELDDTLKFHNFSILLSNFDETFTIPFKFYSFSLDFESFL